MTCEQVTGEAVISICIVAEKVLALLEDESRAHDGEPSQVSPSRRRLHAMVQQGWHRQHHLNVLRLFLLDLWQVQGGDDHGQQRQLMMSESKKNVHVLKDQ